MGIFQNNPKPFTEDMICQGCNHAVACLGIGQCSIAAENKKVAHAMLIHTQDHPPEPAVAPPSWEVYAHVEVDGTLKARPPRILHKGVELEGVTKLCIESSLRAATVLTITIEVPPDGYILIKGAKYDWRSTKKDRDGNK